MTITPTLTNTVVISGQLVIKDVVIYPNPYNHKKDDLNICFSLTGECKLIKVIIYTAGFRMIKQFVYEGNYITGENNIKIQRKYLDKLANGIYYLLLISENIKSRPVNLIILQ
jgi:hypothetical protein